MPALYRFVIMTPPYSARRRLPCMPSRKNTSNLNGYKHGDNSPLQKYKENLNTTSFCYGKVCINLKFNHNQLSLAQISYILCKEMASYWRKSKRQMRMSHLSLLLSHMSFLKESLWLVYFRMIFSFAG